MEKLSKIAAAFLMVYGAMALAGGLKVWSNGDTLTISDLNANFSHIHGSMVGGHGARLVDADVSASANVSTTKIQNGHGIAKAWGEVAGTCVAGTCSISSSMNITSIVWSSTGVYTVTLNYTAPVDTAFAVIANSSGLSTAKCEGVSTSTSTVTVNCNTMTTGAAVNSPFSFVVFDDN